VIGEARAETTEKSRSLSLVLDCQIRRGKKDTHISINLFNLSISLVEAGSMIYGGITGTDSTITVKVNGTSTDLTWTIAQSGSAAGDHDFDTNGSPVHAVVSEGDRIEFFSDGASSTTAAVTMYVDIASN
jgi:hypothetical protein